MIEIWLITRGVNYEEIQRLPVDVKSDLLHLWETGTIGFYQEAKRHYVITTAIHQLQRTVIGLAGKRSKKPPNFAEAMGEFAALLPEKKDRTMVQKLHEMRAAWRERFPNMKK